MYFEKPKQKKTNKYFQAVISVVLVLAIVFVYAARLMQLQVFGYGYYHRRSDIKNAQSVAIKAARGEILDRYGRPIAVNREGYNIVFDASYISMSKINSTITKLMKLLTDNGDEWRDKLPISNTLPYKFTKDENSSEVTSLKSKLELNHYATAENCVNTMIDKYELGGYSSDRQRKLMGIRYTMDAEDFSISYPFTFATDVSEKTRSVLLEQSGDYLGVTIEESSVREYVEGDVMAQLVGNIGPIYAEDWEELKQKGYSYSDNVGKSGIEAAFEDYLRGTDGVKKVLTDSSGNATEVVIDQEAKSGNTVMLSIDLTIQRVAQNSLSNLVKKVQGEGINATSGAVVAINVNTGEILAAANYPTYTLKQYQEDYESLANDSSNPLFNRAFYGTYPPGSTFKPAIAATGITVGTIKPTDTIFCKQYYTYYSDMTWRCMHYHGSLNVMQALSASCNYFFYDTGRRIGINTMNKYCERAGLGVKTGVETGESAGVLAGPTYAKSINTTWNPGDTLQAAIGQSYNLFTPLQLATYTATIANGGTRYTSTLLHRIKSYDLKETVLDKTATVAAETGFSKLAISTVKKGMLSAAFEGTASSVFGNYPIQVGGKTGTSSTIGDDNGLFIAFAPYKDSEIAVAIVLEHGLHGYVAAPVVKDIFDAYFFSKTEQEKQQAANSLIS